MAATPLGRQTAQASAVHANLKKLRKQQASGNLE